MYYDNRGGKARGCNEASVQFTEGAAMKPPDVSKDLIYS
jgi:hypothetical protein